MVPNETKMAAGQGSDGTLGKLLGRASKTTRGVRFVGRKEQASFYTYEEIYERAAMTAGGYSSCFNVEGGFEGNHNEARQRGTLNGWKAAGLPWFQS